MSQRYISENHDFRVEITTFFDFDQSNPINFQYLFRYDILIVNNGEVSAQLLSRKWNIKNAKQEIKIVEGPGVIGQQPQLEPGQSFEYSSFCPLSTMTGEMCGHFNMINKHGQSFKIDTPLFKFSVPQEFIDQY
jgi:ApaG protein